MLTEPRCHPGRRHEAFGLCKSCYESKRLGRVKGRRASRPRKMSSCHPDKMLHGQGLCQTCYSREWHSLHDVKTSAHIQFKSHLKRLYGMTVESYNKMLSDQDGKCAICSEEMSKPYVDHDHACCPGKSTGDCIRGLVCQRCNSGMGMFRDNPDLMRKASVYLNRQKPEDAEVIKQGYPPIASKTVCVDLDQTLYPFGQLFGYPPPLPGAIQGLRLLKEAGFRIMIFTSRLSPEWLEHENRDVQEQIDYITDILGRDEGPFDGICGTKIPAMAYFDDKAIRVSDKSPLLDVVTDFLAQEHSAKKDTSSTMPATGG